MWRRVLFGQGRVVTVPGWKAIEQMFLSTLKQKTEKEEPEARALPPLAEGQTFSGCKAAVREGATSPPKHFTDVIFCERKEWIGIEERSSA